MKYFVRRRLPPLDRLLLIESGSRKLLDKFVPHWIASHGRPEIMDLVTCYPGQPASFPPEAGAVFRVTEYRGVAGARRLRRELLARGHGVAVVICSGEDIMTKWKLLLAATLPVKVLVLNENADYFWFDRSNLRTIRHFLLFRAGLTGSTAVRTLADLALFPFTLAYLLTYTATVHLRRMMRA